MRVVGYLTISKSEKSLKMKIENKVYFVSLFDIVKILNKSREWVPILTNGQILNNENNENGNGKKEINKNEIANMIIQKILK